jgi:Asp-tRNA(Asn)/Glu-tRNA(Gln) amidotransferase A subunit family amidase
MNYHHQTFEPLTFGRARARFLTGEDTPSAYLDRCIDVIEAREPVVKAWASLRIESARRDAEASTARYAAGQPLSTIDGMPIGVKDLISTRELPTTLGIAGNEQAVTLDDSACIQAMQQAGAILLGKVTTTELGAGWPSPTTNPFDPLRTPGGSSSGSAAAVGAGMIPVSIGTQVAGSILRPASYCGNVALKPTMGAIHRGERLGLSHACIGVHAGDLDDLWAAMVEIAVRLPRPLWRPAHARASEARAPGDHGRPRLDRDGTRREGGLRGPARQDLGSGRQPGPGAGQPRPGRLPRVPAPGHGGGGHADLL